MQKALKAKGHSRLCGAQVGEPTPVWHDINDLEIISCCGIGIAVENAIDEVKAVAKYVCDIYCSDGVAKWIAEHIIAIYPGK